MKNFNPYAILGLWQDATENQIKHAYRQMAKAQHPDHGGDHEKFQRLTLARDVLLDPERRKRFDETGEIVEGTPDNARSLALQVISQAVAAMLNPYLSNRRVPALDPRRGNFVSWLQSHFDEQIAAGERGKTDGQEAIAFFRDMQRRLKMRGADGEIDPINAGFGSQIERITNELEGVESSLAALRLAKEIVAQYDFEPMSKSEAMEQTKLNFSVTFS